MRDYAGGCRSALPYIFPQNFILYHQAIGVMEVLMALKSSDMIGLRNISPVRRSQTSCSDGARNW